MGSRELVDWYCGLLAARGYSQSTVYNYRRYVSRWLAWPEPIRDAQGFIDGLSAGGMAPPTVQSIWSAVSGFLQSGGMERMGVSEIPSVKLPRSRNRPTFGVVTRTELEEIRAALPVRGASFPKQRVRTLFYMLYTTGLRMGEALSLRWIDVDYRAAKMTIRSQKSGQGPFVVAILEPLVPELRSLQGFGREPWVYSTIDGDKASRDAIQRQLRRLIQKIAPGRCIHSLRHSFVTHLIEEGVPLPVVQRLARHSRINTTMRYYHFVDAAAEAAVRKSHPWAKKED